MMRTGRAGNSAALASRGAASGSSAARSSLRRRISALQLHVGDLCDLAPLHDLAPHEIGEFLRRPRRRGAAKLDEALLDRRLAQHRIEIGIDLAQDRLRQPGGTAEPGPAIGAVAW